MDYQGYQIEIEQDDDPESPREWDNLGVMVCFHGRYRLGDAHDYRTEDFRGWDELEAQLRRDGAVIVLPLYLYAHGGLRIKVGSFAGLLPQGHAEFDSGQIGFITVGRGAVLAEYGGERLSAKKLAQAEEVLRGEVETYDQYLRGDVWAYTVRSAGGAVLDSCAGLYGRDYVEREAQEFVDGLIQIETEAT